MLLELLDPNTVALNYPAKDAEDVIRRLSGLLAAHHYVQETFADAALRREADLPTGLKLAGDIHAAIPHTDVEHVIKPGVALATLPQPVIFHHMIDPEEEVPVRLVFLLALEQPKSQVAMLQEIATILQSPSLVTQIVDAANIDEIKETLASAGVT